jgi:hypothetical protein
MRMSSERSTHAHTRRSLRPRTIQIHPTPAHTAVGTCHALQSHAARSFARPRTIVHITHTNAALAISRSARSALCGCAQCTLAESVCGHEKYGLTLESAVHATGNSSSVHNRPCIRSAWLQANELLPPLMKPKARQGASTPRGLYPGRVLREKWPRQPTDLTSSCT